MIHISTDYVFDGTKREPYVESDAAGAIGVYGGASSPASARSSRPTRAT